MKKGGDIINWIFKKKEPKKPIAVAFVDYEHWYIALERMYHIKPDIKGWVDDMSKTLDVREIYFFGDFSNPGISEEIPKIRGFSNKIIETKNASAHIQKDFTDFIMLDHIYQEAMARRDNIDVFIIFTGDGHFSSVASFLKNICKKEVGIYGVKDSFSNQLKLTASWWVEYPNYAERFMPYFQMIFTSLDYIRQNEKDAHPSFIRTVETVSMRNSMPIDEVRGAMQWLVDNSYIMRKQETHFGKKLMTIEVDWYKVIADKLWVPEKQTVAIKQQIKAPVKQAQPKPVQKQEPVKQAQPKPVQKQEPVKQVQPKPVQKQEPVKQVQPKPVQKKEPVKQVQPKPVQKQETVKQIQPKPVQKQETVKQVLPKPAQKQETEKQVQPKQAVAVEPKQAPKPRPVQRTVQKPVPIARAEEKPVEAEKPKVEPMPAEQKQSFKVSSPKIEVITLSKPTEASKPTADNSSMAEKPEAVTLTQSQKRRRRRKISAAKKAAELENAHEAEATE